MRRGEIYRTRERLRMRGGKPGFYLIVSRDFIAGNDDISTVICAPIYSEVLGLRTEVLLGPHEGLPKVCSARCDLLMLMFKNHLTGFVATLPASKVPVLNAALIEALGIEGGLPARPITLHATS